MTLRLPLINWREAELPLILKLAEEYQKEKAQRFRERRERQKVLRILTERL